jgi:hypothetical protein
MGKSLRNLLRELHFGGVVMKLMTRKSFCLFILMILFAALMPGASRGQQSGVKPEKAKEGSSNGSEDQDTQIRQLKERALYLLESLTDLKGIEDKVESAHMKADFADLLCTCGEKEEATEIFKKLFENSMRLKTTDHQAHHCHLYKSFAGLCQSLIIF